MCTDSAWKIIKDRKQEGAPIGTPSHYVDLMVLFVDGLAAFQDLIDHDILGPSAERKEHRTVAVAGCCLVEGLSYLTAEILLGQCAGQLSTRYLRVSGVVW